ncbi:unnamed protein product [Periconia digitata]|uniref:F-box domain-containing protein n=1 Tax=Periconia digitata TaxID=1303443 RepID=A0A9W4XUW5_9PLEO|nr:unnamed protein product [Periconia digitata]
MDSALEEEARGRALEDSVDRAGRECASSFGNYGIVVPRRLGCVATCSRGSHVLGPRCIRSTNMRAACSVNMTCKVRYTKRTFVHASAYPYGGRQSLCSPLDRVPPHITTPRSCPRCTMSYLSTLAPELLYIILSYLPPRDVVHFAQTCRRAAQFIQPDNFALWKSAFLHVFDHPRYAWDALVPSVRASNVLREAQWDWHHELRRRMVAFNAVCESDRLTLLKTIEQVVKTLLDIEQTAAYTTRDTEDKPQSLNLAFLSRLQNQSPDFDSIVHDYHRDINSVSLPLEFQAESDRAVTRSMVGRRVAIPPWASQFHVIHGPTKRERDSVFSKAAARAIVYDWNVTGSFAEYGPYDRSGGVNWQAVEAISSLMHRIFDMPLDMYKLTSYGFPMNIPKAIPVRPDSPEQDWAGLTGIWLGTYAFLDYRALVHFNIAHNQEYPLDLGEYEEACGDLMHLDIKVSDDEDLKLDTRLQPSLPYCHDLPILRFTGLSQNQTAGRPSIGVRGFVCLTPSGREVRWRLIIRYAGEDQWQLEGLQPGVRSGAIYGLWSHIDHDDHGPTGPFFYAPAALCDLGETD